MHQHSACTTPCRGRHDVVHISDRDLAGHLDDEVLAAARDEGRVLLSADTDFGELLAKQGLALQSLVLFPSRQSWPGASSRDAAGNLDEVAEDLNAGAIVVFTNDNIRIRKLPVG